VLGDHNDHFTLIAIRRVLLDVMWAREPDTVAGNWGRARQDYLTAISHLSLRTESLLPLLGNPVMTDRLGMGVAILTVVTSLRAGVHSAIIQYDTMRKTQTWYGNAFDAGREYTCDTVVGLDQKKQYLSSSHTFGKWYSRFMKGARLRMGMIRRQNKALTSAMVLAMCRRAELDWRSAQSTARRGEVEDVVCFMLLGFGSGLRGEEVPLVSLEGLLTFWKETREEEDSYMMITLKGRFKGELDERWHIVPICDETRSGIPFRLWMERIMYRRVTLQGRTLGWLFEEKPGKRAKFGLYQDYFRTLIEKVREEDQKLVPSAGGDVGLQSFEIPSTGGSTGDHDPQGGRSGNRTDQSMAKEGGSSRLRGRAPHETGVHPSAECLAHHEEILKGSLTEDYQGYVRGGLSICV
jgi:hypothetical protein